MSEEKLDARSSQGFINAAQAVEQHFGDQQDIDTQGGDAAGRDIHKSTIINLIVPNGDAGLSQQLLQELMQILGQPESVQSVGKAYRSSLPPDARVSRPEVDTSSEIVTQLQAFGRLQEFVERLVQDEQLPQSMRDQLDNLIPHQRKPQPTNVQKQPMLQAYLLMVLDPDPGTDRFFANAWLVPDDTVQDPLTRFVPLDLEAEQKGVSCSIEQISALIGEFLIQSEDYLFDRTDHYNLTVEVFLPRDYLSTEVESWKILDPVDDQPFSIGTKYSVLVRSYERTQRKYLRLYRKPWRTNWDRVKQNLGKVPSHEMFEQLDCLEDWTERMLTTSLLTKLGLKLTCSPAAKHKEFFSSILKAAVPIAIWSRCSIPELDLATEMDALLMSGSLLELLERIRLKRWEASGDCEQHLGQHLTILWEDLDRLPPVTELLRPGQ
ncbi:MAG: hypothetical protein KME15_13935 [Drouetiella hepatica Uher 2000/2452]|jgi:hypothetical protein|uniref:Uncharacterized protein n=1 Tax=Drouetiella hepatica Uher 2000/2452 TaxID=904376 RepID=A0A951QBJ4_9CYAN|nr:hypothetical protein [Drouetiella hepatica Uher 2000/2452]